MFSLGRPIAYFVHKENSEEESTHISASNYGVVRPWSPIEDIFVRSITAEPEGTHHNGPVRAAEALDHAKFYSFAH